MPLATQVKKSKPANCFGGNLTKCWGVNLRWTSIPSRGNRNIPSRFILQKLEISRTDEPSGSPSYDWGQTLPFVSIDVLYYRCRHVAIWQFSVTSFLLTSDGLILFFVVVFENDRFKVSLSCFFLGKRRPRTTQSLSTVRQSRHQEAKRVASAPVVAGSLRNQVKAGIIRAMLPRTQSSTMRSAFSAAELWRSRLLTSRPTLEKRLSTKDPS